MSNLKRARVGLKPKRRLDGIPSRIAHRGALLMPPRQTNQPHYHCTICLRIDMCAMHAIAHILLNSSSTALTSIIFLPFSFTEVVVLSFLQKICLYQHYVTFTIKIEKSVISGFGDFFGCIALCPFHWSTKRISRQGGATQPPPAERAYTYPFALIKWIRPP